MDKTIKFLNNNSPYAKGDIAGFNEELADKYISRGLAEEWTQKVNVINKVGDKNVTNRSSKSKKILADTTK